MILVIGYGSLGRKVVNNAKNVDKVTVIDKNDAVFESHENGDFNYVIGDASEPDVLERAKIKDADTIIVLTNDFEVNKKIVGLIPEINAKAYLIVRGMVRYPEIYNGLTINKVIYPLESAARDVVNEIEKSKLRRKLNELKEIAIDAKNSFKNYYTPEETPVNNHKAPFLILMHKNPDPDAMASAMALKAIFEKWGVSSEIAYGGKIGYDENKAMVNLLGIKLNQVDELNALNYCSVAVVDLSSSKTLPIDVDRSKLSVIVDHHDNGDLTARYMDVNPEIGATATILTKYLIELDIVPNRNLSTALYYAITSDTNYFKRKTSKKDFEAASYLQGLMDPKVLEMIENPDIDTETMEILGKAIMNRKIVKGSIALSYVGNIKNRDALPRAAEFLLKTEGINTTYIFGISDNEIHISSRTKDLRIDVGNIMKSAFGGGGHQASAAASVELGIFQSVSDKSALRKLVEEAIQAKIFETMGIEEEDMSSQDKQ
ncbi:TrkA-N domain protein [Methanococcus vannielii SB]|jgi:nanoRNase/pAp phosphatase (c-di-AMP/oligoRNAs hydrolase)|uniref:TrkA-N domain protein n=1 Tax=Methanococcus vannielii (strain ATCC 35089 / DSM 1224 / JCM 13029 / OCM 148 / SB) TaxID=406327 RepID=A6URS2_METVS|nr:DHH family phosphoesterase [Methanococcus vannielii]ABR55194.1 TrkA-N domain protein [Methanococcus vannielii SB]